MARWSSLFSEVWIHSSLVRLHLETGGTLRESCSEPPCPVNFRSHNSSVHEEMEREARKYASFPPPLAWITQLLRKISSNHYFLNLIIINFTMITLKWYVLHADTPTNIPVTALSRQILSGCIADPVGSCTALSFCAPQVLPCLSNPSLNHLSSSASYPLLTSICSFSIGNGVGIFTLWSFIWVAVFSLGSSLLISPLSLRLYWQ